MIDFIVQSIKTALQQNQFFSGGALLMILGTIGSLFYKFVPRAFEYVHFECFTCNSNTMIVAPTTMKPSETACPVCGEEGEDRGILRVERAPTKISALGAVLF